VTLAIGGLTEPTIGGEHLLLFMTVAGMLHNRLGMPKNTEEAPDVNKP